MIIHDLEQRSDAWYAIRCGVPTASCAGKIVTSAGKPSKQLEGYAETLACESFTGNGEGDFQGTYFTDRGRDLEPDAIAAYEFQTDFEVMQCGFVTSDNKTIGVSPDGLVGDDGLVEIKCLKAENHLSAIKYFNKHGKPPASYIPQIQMQMMVAERAWCDMWFYHPDLPGLRIRCAPDLQFQTALNDGLNEVMQKRDEYIDILKTQSNVSEF